MRSLPAILLGVSVLTAQLLHGGAFVPALAWPAYLVLLLAALCACGIAVRSPSPPSPTALLVAAVAGAMLVVRSLADADPVLARVDAGSILAAWLAFFVSATLSDAKARINFLLVLMIGVLGQAVVGALQVGPQGDFSTIHWFSEGLRELYEGKFSTRARGTFLNPNQLAFFAGTVAVFCVSLAVWGRLSILSRTMLAFLALLCVAIEVMAASRGGLASLAAGFVFLIFATLAAASILTQRMSGGGRVLFGAIAAFVLALVVAAAAISGSWTAQGRMESFAIDRDVRGELFNEGVRAFQSSPLLGHGPGSFIYLARSYREGRHQSGDAVFAHNDWLQLAVEYGFAGLVIFGLALAVLLGGGTMRFARVVFDVRNNRAQATSNTIAILLGALAAAILMAVHSLVDFNMRIPANALLAGTVLGFLTNPDAWVLQSRRRIIFARATNVLLLLVFGGALAVTAMRFVRADWLEVEADNARLARSWRKAAALASEGLKADPDNSRLLSVLARAQFSQVMGGAMRDGYGRARRVFIDEPSDGSPRRDSATAESLAQCRANYEKLISLSPRERAGFVEYGRVLMQSDDPEAATLAAMTAIELDPRHGYAYLALGDISLDSERYADARKVFFVGAHAPGGELNAAKFEAVEEILANEAARAEAENE